MRRVWVPDRYWLTTRPVVSQHRVVVVDDLGRLLERHAVEAGLAVGVEERPPS